MENKIALYKDILLTEPFSRVFYPLSIALLEEGNAKEAAHYLEQGLLYHTNFLEARMLFVEVLSSLGEKEKQDAEIEKIMAIFKKYPSFWQLWAEKEENEDISLALSFVAHALRNHDVTFKSVLISGLQNLTGTTCIPQKEDMPVVTIEHAQAIVTDSDLDMPIDISAEALAEEEHDEEASSLDTSIHTRSMADLLAEQGELEQALVIYKALLEQEEDVDVKAELKFIIQEFEARIKEDVAPLHASEHPIGSNKEKLINTLATLVSRLDERAEAIQPRV